MWTFFQGYCTVALHDIKIECNTVVPKLRRQEERPKRIRIEGKCIEMIPRFPKPKYPFKMLTYCCSLQSPFSSSLHSISSSYFVLNFSIMSGCGSAKCGCGSGCQCSSGCGCCKSLAEPTFGGLRNYNSEGDCKCGLDCNCTDCACHQ